MIKVEKLIPGGQALATHPDGRKIFFWNALPGELIADYEITKRKTHYYEAIATKIENPSAHRVEPKDPCYLATSPWQIFDWSYELAQKQSLVQEIFREHKIPIALPEIKTDDRQYYYRNKMEYSLYWDNATQVIDLAFHTRGSHHKIPIGQSTLENPAIFAKAQAIVADLNKHHEPARKYQSILLRANQRGEVSGGLYENHQPHPTFAPLSDQILGYTYHYSPNGFFQINLPVYELALTEIKTHISTQKVLDLYAGVGTIGLSVACDRVLTLVESDPSAFTELSRNVAIESSQDLSPITAHLAKSEQALDFITSDTTVILDPPRAGCHPALIQKLTAEKPPKIIYLSCNPATQARDLESLLQAYHLEKVVAYNFFPRTPHIENLAVLSSK